jgi:hypothetical protein
MSRVEGQSGKIVLMFLGLQGIPHTHASTRLATDPKGQYTAQDLEAQGCHMHFGPVDPSDQRTFSTRLPNLVTVPRGPHQTLRGLRFVALPLYHFLLSGLQDRGECVSAFRQYGSYSNEMFRQ